MVKLKTTYNIQKKERRTNLDEMVYLTQLHPSVISVIERVDRNRVGRREGMSMNEKID